MRKYPRYSAGLCDTYVKAKTTEFVGFATENTGILFFVVKLRMQIIASSLFRVNILFYSSVKATEANSGTDETLITAKR
jgi:hypothetical protein